MLSTAEAKVLDNSATVVMALHKLIPQATVIQPQRCMFVVAQWVALFQKALISKRGLDILIMQRPSVIHAALGITAATTVKGNWAHFHRSCSAIFSRCFLLNRGLLLDFESRYHFGRAMPTTEANMKSLLWSAVYHILQWLLGSFCEPLNWLYVPCTKC